MKFEISMNMFSKEFNKKKEKDEESKNNSSDKSRKEIYRGRKLDAKFEKLLAHDHISALKDMNTTEKFVVHTLDDDNFGYNEGKQIILNTSTNLFLF